MKKLLLIYYNYVQFCYLYTYVVCNFVYIFILLSLKYFIFISIKIYTIKICIRSIKICNYSREMPYLTFGPLKLQVVPKIGCMRQGASVRSLTGDGGWSPASLAHRIPPRSDPVTLQQVEVYRLYPFDI